MGCSTTPLLLLLSALLLLSFSQGFGRKQMEKPGTWNYARPLQENGGLSREMMELDYIDAGPNTNTNGYLPPPPPIAHSPRN